MKTYKIVIGNGTDSRCEASAPSEAAARTELNAKLASRGWSPSDYGQEQVYVGGKLRRKGHTLYTGRGGSVRISGQEVPII